MRGFGKQYGTFSERFVDERKMKILEIPYAAVNELRRTAGGPAGKIIFFEKDSTQAVGCRHIGKRGPVNAPADEKQVINFVR